MSGGSVLRQLVYRSHGVPLSSLSLVTGSVPKPGPGELLLRYIASPINPADINQVEGTYKKMPPLPAVGGNEGLAEVAQIGKDCNTTLKEGDWVIPKQSCLGTWTSHGVGAPDNFLQVPRDMDPLQLATISVNPCTAYRMLHDFVNLKEGDYIVQNGATSAVGQAVIQLAKAFGWKTINIVRERPSSEVANEEMKQHLQSLGADHIVTDTEVTSTEGRALFKDTKPRLALNCVGGKPLTTLCKVLPPHTPVVTYGGMSKKPITLPTGSLIFQDLHFHGFWMTRWNDTADMGDRQRMLDIMFDLVRDKKLATRAATHPIEEWQLAVAEATAPYKLDKHVFVFGQ